MSTHVTAASNPLTRGGIARAFPWVWWAAVGFAIVALSLALYPGIARA